MTGKDVQFPFPVQSNAAQIEAYACWPPAMSQASTTRLEPAGRGSCAGAFRPFAIDGCPEDGSFGYEMEIITYPGSGIESVRGPLRGQTLPFTLGNLELRVPWPRPPRFLMASSVGMVGGPAMIFRADLLGRDMTTRILRTSHNRDYVVALESPISVMGP